MDYKNVQKIEITQSLCIETTRRCNMRCAHCMRGDAESIDLDSNALYDFMQRVKGIGTTARRTIQNDSAKIKKRSVYS